MPASCAARHRRSPATSSKPLAGSGRNDDRLEHATLTDRVGQRGERDLVEVLARLVGVRPDVLNCDLMQATEPVVQRRRRCATWHASRPPTGSSIVSARLGAGLIVRSRPPAALPHPGMRLPERYLARSRQRHLARSGSADQRRSGGDPPDRSHSFCGELVLGAAAADSVSPPSSQQRDELRSRDAE